MEANAEKEIFSQQTPVAAATAAGKRHKNPLDLVFCFFISTLNFKNKNKKKIKLKA